MSQIFADTNYWAALLNRKDSLHRNAVSITERIGTGQIVTSEMVFAELLNGVSNGRHLRRNAARMIENLRREGSTLIVEQTGEQFQQALQRYERSADKQWSLTDCASFLIMEERGIRQALTYDRHFEQAGFEALLR